MRRLALCCVLVTGCIADEAVVPFADWNGLNLRIALGLSDTLYVELEHARGATEPCRVLRDDFTATVDGVPLAVREPGHKTGELDGAIECAFPRLELADDTLAGGILVLGDETRTLRCELPDLRARREGTLASSDLRAGEPVELVWSPASDLRLFGVSVGFVDKTTRVVTFAEDATSAGDRVMFRVPSLRPGVWELQVTGRLPKADCEGVANRVSSAFTSFHDGQDVTILP